MAVADVAISKMKAPWEKGVICIDITNRCNLGCSNCTRLLENQDEYWDMSIDNFRLALRSLSDYDGVIAVIGGNPCLHKDFDKICRVISEEVPNKLQRGLWTNNAFRHVNLAAQTFGMFNLNGHGDKKGERNLIELFKKSNKNGNLYVGSSLHSPLLVAVKDLFAEEEMWERISNCDINKNWSGTIIQNANGELRAYFCEVAASFDLARNTDFGYKVEKDWWKQPIEFYSSQIKKFCPNCGASARIKPTKDSQELDTYSKSNEDLIKKIEGKGRNSLLLDSSIDTKKQNNKPITEYMTHAIQTTKLQLSDGNLIGLTIKKFRNLRKFFKNY